MAPGRALVLGVDGLVSCIYRVSDTSALIKDNYHNLVPTTRFTNLGLLRLINKTVSQHLQQCVSFLLPSFPDDTSHSAKSYYKVTQQGPREYLSGFEDEMSVIEESEVQKSP